VRRTKRATAVLIGTMLVLMASLNGCGVNRASQQAGGKASSAESSATHTGEPSLGMVQLDSGVPAGAVSFSDGVALFGNQFSVKNTPPVLWRPLGGTVWSAESVADTFLYAMGTAELGNTVVVAGTDLSDAKVRVTQTPFVATWTNGGIADMPELSQAVFGGVSADVRAVGLTGSPLDADTLFIVVGGMATTTGGTVGTPNGTKPFAIVSADGSKWGLSGELPLPDGTTGAMAYGVTYSPPDSVYPGLLVVGVGYMPDVGSRTIGVVWRSMDRGQTWKIVSDDTFAETGRNVSARFVASDGANVVVAGQADAPYDKAALQHNTQVESINWFAGSDGKWHRNRVTLAAGRSGVTTALLGRTDGGFILASESYDTASVPTAPGGKLDGNPAAQIIFTANGAHYSDITDSIDKMDSAAVVSGVAEFGNRDVFVGMDNSRTGAVWVVDRAAIK